MSNPLLNPQFKKEDARWKFMSCSARMSLRLSTYSTALLDILTRAEELQVSEEDRFNIRTILITISELLFSQSARSSALGLSHQADSALVQSLPIRGPYLFNDHILDAVTASLGDCTAWYVLPKYRKDNFCLLPQ